MMLMMLAVRAEKPRGDNADDSRFQCRLLAETGGR